MPYYQLACGWHDAPLLTWLCTPDLTLALQTLAALQQQGYAWCALHVSTLPLTGRPQLPLPSAAAAAL
jgi:hypothetical protein